MITPKRFLLGQYQPGDGVVHRLDPRTKIIFTMIVMVAALINTSPLFYLALLIGLILLLALCRIGGQRLLGSLKPIFWFVALTALFHLLFSGQDDPNIVISIWGFSVSRSALMLALLYSLRILIFVMATFVISLTTNPVVLSEGIVSLLGPLKLLRVPVNDLGMILFIALRFIPVLADEMETIRKVQSLRGIEFGSGRFLARMRSTLALVLPVFFSSLRRADELSIALYTRGYRSGRPRSSMRPLRFAMLDRIVLFFLMAGISIVIAARYSLWPG